MTSLILILLAAVFALVSVLTLRWWFSGGAFYGSTGDPSMIAFGFPVQKYDAIARLLDLAESRALQREHRMPTDLIAELEKGRRQVLVHYLSELTQDFRKATGAYARAQALSSAPLPSAARHLFLSLLRYRRLRRAALRKALQGSLSQEDAAQLVAEVRIMFEKAARSSRLPPGDELTAS